MRYSDLALSLVLAITGGIGFPPLVESQASMVAKIAPDLPPYLDLIEQPESPRPTADWNAYDDSGQYNYATPEAVYGDATTIGTTGDENTSDNSATDADNSGSEEARDAQSSDSSEMDRDSATDSREEAQDANTEESRDEANTEENRDETITESNDSTGVDAADLGGHGDASAMDADTSESEHQDATMTEDDRQDAARSAAATATNEADWIPAEPKAEEPKADDSAMEQPNTDADNYGAMSVAPADLSGTGEVLATEADTGSSENGDAAMSNDGSEYQPDSNATEPSQSTEDADQANDADNGRMDAQDSDDTTGDDSASNDSTSVDAGDTGSNDAMSSTEDSGSEPSTEEAATGNELSTDETATGDESMQNSGTDESADNADDDDDDSDETEQMDADPSTPSETPSEADSTDASDAYRAKYDSEFVDYPCDYGYGSENARVESDEFTAESGYTEAPSGDKYAENLEADDAATGDADQAVAGAVTWARRSMADLFSAVGRMSLQVADGLSPDSED